MNVLQKPIVSTSTGVPNTFSKTTPYYFNTSSETASAGNTGAAQVAKTNTLNVVEVGTVFKVSPRYNPKTRRNTYRCLIYWRCSRKFDHRNKRK